MTHHPFQPGPFGKYFLIEETFVGRHIRTYKAKTYGAKGFEKILSLVRISPELGRQTKFIEALTEEFRRVVKITHPNVLPVYDFGNVKGEYFLTQEFLTGLTFAELATRLREVGEPLTTAECLYLMSEVLKGLHAVHGKFQGAAQVLHGHIQPRNLILSREGEVKIAGLGFERLALLFNSSDKFDTNYFDEKIRKTGQFTQRYDLFLAAMTLFEILAGFPLMAKLPEDSGENKISGEFLQNHVPSALIAFFVSALAEGEDSGFASALDMSVALQRLLYSEHADFSAQSLFRRIQKFFDASARPTVKGAPQNEIGPADTLDELVKSSRFQVNLAHREGTEYSSLLADTVALAPGDFFPVTQTVVVQPGSVAQPQTERPDDSRPISHSISPHDGDEPASQVQKTQRYAWIGISLVAFLGLFALLWVLERKQPTPPQPDDPVNPEVIVYELSVTSRPDGADVWIDGTKTEQSTPTTFLDLKAGQDYRIVLRKDGFEDYVTVFGNDSGKDQVLDVTLRAR